MPTCVRISNEQTTKCSSGGSAVGTPSRPTFFHLFKKDLHDVKSYALSLGYASLDEYIDRFCEDTRNRIREAIAKGYDVYIGKLHSDNDEIETIFCCDAFVIEGKTLIIDATEDG